MAYHSGGWERTERARGLISFGAAQMDGIRAARLEAFVAQTVEHLRSRFPDAGLDATQLGAVVHRALALGARHGVTSAYDLRRLAECVLEHGPEFPETERTAWARRILRRDDLDGRRKMDAIAAHETFARPGP